MQRGGGDAAELGAGDAGNRLHRSGRFVTLASGLDSDNDALPIRAYARVLGATVKKGETLEYKLGAKRHGYLVPAVGTVEVNGVQAGTRDGVAIKKEEKLTKTPKSCWLTASKLRHPSPPQPGLTAFP